MNEILKMLYQNPLTDGNIGRDKFYFRVYQKYVDISRRKVDSFIKNDETHQIHQQITRKMCIVRPLEVSEKPMLHWQMNLIDIEDSKKWENLNYRYCLTLIDIFSKYVWVQPLKMKDAIETADALVNVFNKVGASKTLQLDNRSEFKNQTM
jgi:hypothetical protein